MEALFFFKFWKPNPSQKAEINKNTGPGTMFPKNIEPDGRYQHDEEGDDSFIELELITATDPKCSDTTSSISGTPVITIGSPMKSYSCRLECGPNDHSCTISKPSRPKKAGPLLEPSSDSISKRKVLPIEPGLKPQSPISLLKAAPSLKVLTFKKSKSTARRDLLTDDHGSLECTVEAKEICSCVVLGRDNSLRRYIREEPLVGNHNCNANEEWKLGKYLRLIYRPLNAMKEKKVTKKVFSSTDHKGLMGSPSPSCSPLTIDSSPRKQRTESTGSGRIQVAYKKLGKSKSSAVAVAAPARRDDSLALHHDGIQGAILHCKKSFNSSRDPSFLSRFACETLQEYGESPRSSSEVN